MFTRRLERDLVELMPCARRYSRALVGNISTADSLLAKCAGNVIANAPPFSLLTPRKMVLPWLFVELHKLLDTDYVAVDIHNSDHFDQGESILHAQFDSGLAALSDIQRRAYLLTTLEQFPLPVTASILSLSVEQVRDHFQQAHALVSDHVVVEPVNSKAA